METVLIILNTQKETLTSSNRSVIKWLRTSNFAAFLVPLERINKSSYSC